MQPASAVNEFDAAGSDGAGWPDEELVRVYQVRAVPVALAELTRGTQKLRDAQVNRLARRAHLGPEDLLDARQQAFLEMWEAVVRYDLSQVGRPNGCRFRSFLTRCLSARLQNFVRDVRRVERHLDRSRDAAAALASSPGQGPCAKPAGDRATHGIPDPLHAAHQKELWARVVQITKQLSEADRQLFESRAAGLSLHGIARERALSYEGLKHRWNHLRVRLQGQLHDWAG